MRTVMAWAALCLAWGLAAPSAAQTAPPAASVLTAPAVPSLSPADEARFVRLARQLRCLVCQNQSIEDSNAELAMDLRILLRERIAAGDSDDAILAFMTARYGEWVLMRPPVNARTYALWVGPFLLLGVAGVLAAAYVRRQQRQSNSPQPLDGDEQRRLARLMDRTDDD